MNDINILLPSSSLVYAAIAVFLIFIITYFVTKKSLNFNKTSKLPDIMIAVA